MKMTKEHVFMIVALLGGGLAGFMFAKHKYSAKTGMVAAPVTTPPVTAPVAPVTVPVVAPVAPVTPITPATSSMVGRPKSIHLGNQ